jgi:NAD(P)-dependent dehydrogenase (short-subunit alcohol dehydrogenase family)
MPAPWPWNGIKVNALAPGLRRTDLNVTAAGDCDPAEAAAGTVRLAPLPDYGAVRRVHLLGRNAGSLVRGRA